MNFRPKRFPSKFKIFELIETGTGGCKQYGVIGFGIAGRLPDRVIHVLCEVGWHHRVKGGIDRFGMSARTYHRVLRVARTIADLAGANDIAPPHVAEALSMRGLPANYAYEHESPNETLTRKFIDIPVGCR